jgi:hypothetical protein
MPVVFTVPVVQRAAQNPADMLLGDVSSLDLGFCEPRLNGNSMLQARGVMRELPPIPMNEPVKNVVPGQTVGHFSAQLQAPAPVNTVSWLITVPPQPVDGSWRSQPTTGLAINQLVARMAKVEPSFRGMANQKFPGDWKFTLVLNPQPDAAAFMNHIIWHEHQHAADHHWLAQQIIGPWQSWVDAAIAKNLWFDCPDRLRLITALQSPGMANPVVDYALSINRIVRYWQATLSQSGDLYHRTPAGACPAIRFQKLAGTPRVTGASNMELHLTIQAVTPIQAPINHLSPPHTIFNILPLTRTMDGNEPKITPNGAGGARVLNRPDVHGALVGARIDIPYTPDDDNYELPPLFP